MPVKFSVRLTLYLILSAYFSNGYFLPDFSPRYGKIKVAPVARYPLQSRLFLSHDPLLNEEIEKIKLMKTKEIKDEMTKRGILFTDIFEKNEFVERLAMARIKGASGASTRSEYPESSSKYASASNKPSEGPTAQKHSSAPNGKPGACSGGGTCGGKGDGSCKQTKAEPRPSSVASSDGLLEKEKAVVAEMRMSEIKKELVSRGLPTTDMFEKSEFVQRLAEARVQGTKKRPDAEQNEQKVNQQQEAETYRDVEVKRMKNDKSAPESSGQYGRQAGPFGAEGMGGIGGMGGMGNLEDLLKNMGGVGGMGGPGGFGGTGRRP